MEPNKPLTELSKRISQPKTFQTRFGDIVDDLGDDLEKVQLIIAELAKIEEPVDRSKVKPSIDGRIHFADILKADEERAFDVLRRCREIAAGKKDCAE